MSMEISVYLSRLEKTRTIVTKMIQSHSGSVVFVDNLQFVPEWVVEAAGDRLIVVRSFEQVMGCIQKHTMVIDYGANAVKWPSYDHLEEIYGRENFVELVLIWSKIP